MKFIIEYFPRVRQMLVLAFFFLVKLIADNHGKPENQTAAEKIATSIALEVMDMRKATRKEIPST